MPPESPNETLPMPEADQPSWRVGRFVGGGPPSVPDTAFLQQRLATLGKVMFIVAMSGVLLRGVIEASTIGPAQLLEPNYLLNVAGNLCFGVLWVLCAGPVRTPRFVAGLESLCLFAACVAYSFMGAELHALASAADKLATPQALTLSHEHTSTVVLLVLTYALVIRAAVVPSTARRTRWLTGLLGVPLVVISTHAYAPLAVDASRVGHAVQNAIWWSFTVIICSVISTTIYGLRKKVVEARKLGQYTLEEKLGQGGMGMVYRASHSMLRRPTAIKLLRPSLVDPTDLIRFEREVIMTAKLSHPNTVTIFDYGHTQDGIFYYAMEMLEGTDLWNLVKHCGPQDPRRVIHILERVADALSEAHSIGLIHRDIKPSNIVLCARGGQLDVPKVVDFGLVRGLEEVGEIPLTVAGQVLGTPLYMPPEAILAGKTIDARSDLYALGCVGYFLITGQDVFRRSSQIELFLAQVKDQPIPPSERLGRPVPHGLQEIIMCCLAKEPDERPQSADELRQLLQSCRDIEDWGPSDARDWWAQHGDELPGSRTAEAAYPEVMPSEARTILAEGLPAEQ